MAKTILSFQRAEEDRSQPAFRRRFNDPHTETAFLATMRELERRFPDHADALGAIAGDILARRVGR